MELFVQSNEFIRKMFESRYNVSETINKNTNIVVVVRSNEQDPKTMNDIIRQTDGMLPLIVLTGAEDQLGKSYEDTAIIAGVPIDYIIKGTEWRMSKVKEMLEDIENHPVLPDPKVFMDHESINMVKDKRSAEISEEQLDFQHVSETQIVSVVGFNGGVGLSTVATSLSAFYHSRGLKTRIIDLSPSSDTVNHFNLQKKQGIHVSCFGEMACTGSHPEFIHQALHTPADVIVVDLPLYTPYISQFIEISQKIVVVLNPSEIDYTKLKEYEEKLDMSKVMICMNKINSSKPLRQSFTSLIEQDFNQPLIMIEDSDEVASAYADKKPAYLRYPFKQAMTDLAGQLQIE